MILGGKGARGGGAGFEDSPHLDRLWEEIVGCSWCMCPTPSPGRRKLVNKNTQWDGQPFWTQHPGFLAV